MNELYAPYAELVIALSMSSCGASFPRCCFPASFVLAFSFDLDDEERTVDGCRCARAWVFLSSGVGVLFDLSSHTWRFTRMFRSHL